MEKLKPIWLKISFNRRIVWISCLLGLLILTVGNYFWADLTFKRVSASQEKEKSEKIQHQAFQEKEKSEKAEMFNFVKEITSRKLKTIKSSDLKVERKVFISQVNSSKNIYWLNNTDNEFPENFIAKNKNELKTIIDVIQYAEATKQYTDRSSGYVYIYIISVIDVNKGAIILKKEIRGSEPPSTKRGRGAAYGTDPSREVLDFIRKLPIDS